MNVSQCLSYSFFLLKVLEKHLIGDSGIWSVLRGNTNQQMTQSGSVAIGKTHSPLKK